MSLRTKEPRYQATPTPSASRGYPEGELVRGLPEEIRYRPKHSTTFVAGFVAVRRTPSTRTFLSQLIVPTNFNIQRFIRARNPLRMNTQDLFLKIYFCFHEYNIGLPGEHPLLESRQRSSLWFVIAAF
jgi:hypothetical protein